MKTRILLASCFAIGLLAGCKGNHSGPSASGGSGGNGGKAVEKKPLAIDWSKEKYTAGEGHGEVHANGTKVWVQMEGFPKGTQYAVGDQKGTIEDSYGSYAEVDVADKLGDVTIDGLEKVDSGLSLKLSYPDGREGESKLPPVDFRYGLAEALKNAEHGPVRFGKEADDPKKTDSLLLVQPMQFKLFGRGGKLSEVDYIAISTQLTEVTGTKTCTGYTDNAGNAMPAMTVNLKESEVVIYDRRTGDVVTKKTFEPDNTCPQFVFTAKDANSMDNYPPDEIIEAWLKTQVKR